MFSTLSNFLHASRKNLQILAAIPSLISVLPELILEEVSAGDVDSSLTVGDVTLTE